MKIFEPIKLITSMKQMLCIVLLLLGFAFTANAQQVTGVVTGEDGQTLIGASVVLKVPTLVLLQIWTGNIPLQPKKGRIWYFP